MADDQQWVIRTTWRRSGDVAYLANMGLTSAIGSARRFTSEDAARYVAYDAREHGEINDFEVMPLPFRPRKGVRIRD